MQRTVSCGLAFLLIVSAVHGATLTPVGVLDPASPYSVLRGISADGTYVVGGSQAVIAQGLVEVPIIWSQAGGLVQLPCPSGANTRAHGVAVGRNGNAGNIIISGLHENLLTHRYYKALLTNLAGGVWADSGAAGGFALSDLRGGTSNVLRNALNANPSQEPLGPWYASAQRANGRVARLRGDPFIGWDGSGSMSGASVSSYGCVVGTWAGVTPRVARWESPQGDSGNVPGGMGIRTEGYGISSHFGISTTANFDVQWISGLDRYGDAVYRAFRWKRGDAAMTILNFACGDYLSVAYTISNNGVAAGGSYGLASGGGSNAWGATIWDTSGTWDSTGKPRLLKAVLNAAGVDTSAWTRLERIYAISDDGRTVAGEGIWAADGSTRGFVASITEAPPTLPLVGACCVSQGPNAGTCSVVTAGQCADTPFGTYMGDDTCCDACPGACCGPDAPCSIETAANCTAPRVFRGPSTLCDETTCVGACCGGFKSCAQAQSHLCPAADFKGVGTQCEGQNCPCTSTTQLWADSDTDQDVDMDDFGALQACFTGLSIVIPPGCACFDRIDPAGSLIDLADFNEFVKCATGPAIPYTLGALPAGCVAP